MRTTALLLALAFATPAHADPVDDYIKSTMKAQRIPAIVYGVFKDGKILKSAAYGSVNLEQGVRATTDHVFEIGSVSKQFTATTLLMLMEEGKLTLEDRIDKYVEGLPEGWRTVTLRQLLAHTSGIPDIEEIFGYDSYRNIYTPAQIIAVANSKPMDFPPGTRFHYSNTGYFLLGMALEKLEGKSYARVMQDRIFKPLGMSQTRESDPTAIIPNRAGGYQRLRVGWGNRDPMQPSACLGAGTLLSTIGDMAKWDAAINHDRLLRKATQELMWTPAKLSNGQAIEYGLGWFIEPWRGRASVAHSGGTAGFSCDYRRFHDLGISYMVFSNVYATGVEGIGIRAVDWVSPGVSYASAQPVKSADPAQRARMVAALTEVGKGGASSLYYTDKMWALFRPAWRTAWKDRVARMKGFVLIEEKTFPPRDSGQGDMVVARLVYRMDLPEGATFVEFRLTPDGKIARLIGMDY